MKQKYFFFRLETFPGGKRFVTIANQKLGQNKILEGVLVSDTRRARVLERARKVARDGDIFFSTNLRPYLGRYTTDDVFPLDGCDNVFFHDAQDVYKSLLSENS